MIKILMLEPALDLPALEYSFGEHFSFISTDNVDPIEVDAMFIKLGQQVTAEFLQKYTNLRYILTPTTGLDHIDTSYCLNQKIEILCLRSNPKLLNGITSTLEIIWWHVLEATRQPNVANEEVAAGVWNRNNHFSLSLAGRNIGIVGFGRIGKQIAEVAKAFQMNVFVSDINLDTSGYAFVNASSSSEIFKSCSIVVIAVTDSWENVDLIDEKYLSLIPEPGIVLINCSRGRILNENHVKEYFFKNRIRTLGLDVLKNESQSENSWLFDNEIWKLIHDYPQRVRITPHIGGATWDSLKKAEYAVFSTLRDKVK